MITYQFLLLCVRFWCRKFCGSKIQSLVWLGAIIKQVVVWYPGDDQISMVFGVLIMVLLTSAVSWGIVLCCRVNGYWCFKGTLGPHLHGQAFFFITLLQLLAPSNENATVSKHWEPFVWWHHIPEDLSVREGQVSEVLALTQFWYGFLPEKFSLHLFAMKAPNLIWFFWPGNVACQCVSNTFMLLLWRGSNTLGHSS